MPASSPDLIIPGLHVLAPRFPVLLCDLWGVIHNGRTVYDGAADALVRFRQGGGTVVLVSNAPRPADKVVVQLDGLGLPREAWDGIVTSGDVARAEIAAAVTAGKALFHLGPDRDRPLFEGLPARFVGEEDADFVVCTGLFDDVTEKAGDYRPVLGRLLARAVPMLCANPDLVVDRGGTMIDCAGAVAALYEEMGGQVTTCGKPFAPIYEAALALAASIRRSAVAPAEALMVGDSVRTDLAGAAAVGCGALFVAGGIHGAELRDARGDLDPARLASTFAARGLTPDGVLPRLIW